MSGELNARSLPRIADRLAGGTASGDLSWRITGMLDAQKRPALRLTIEGMVPLVCQRCLEAFVLAIDQETLVLVARDESELARLDQDEPEVVLASGLLDARALVEDELLLTLPFSPRHAEDECPSPRSGRAAERADSPFSRLRELKKGID